MCAHARSGDVGCDGEIRQPEVFDVGVAKSRKNRAVEILAGEH